jgi:WD40 repeat protein
MISGDTQARPLIRTFYDHAEPINDLDFHPRSTILISSAKDNCIKYIFTFSLPKMNSLGDYKKSLCSTRFCVISCDVVGSSTSPKPRLNEHSKFFR